MQAAEGDHITVRSAHVGEPDRTGQVVQVRGADGTPPWLVRWTDDGHEGLYVPGADTVVHRRA